MIPCSDESRCGDFLWSHDIHSTKKPLYDEETYKTVVKPELAAMAIGNRCLRVVLQETISLCQLGTE